MPDGVNGSAVDGLAPASAYIHVPFCVRKCAYCDFLSFADASSHERIDAYVDAVCREIEMTPAWFGAEAGCDAAGGDGADGAARPCKTAARGALKTIYFGGGTPSLLSPSHVGKILSSLRGVFGIEDGCEITLEANPGTIDMAKLGAFREEGVNRLSLGIQSLDDEVLTTLGRIHDSEAAKRAVEDALEAGFLNISCDMMLGIPGQTMDSVKETLGFFLEKEIPHVSLYSLILEEGTPLFSRYDGDIEKYVSQETDREMYHYVTSTLREYGYVHYEISNMAIPGYESRHNSMYWRAEPYYAFGVGASYYLGRERGRHVENLGEYIEAMLGGRQETGVGGPARQAVKKEDVLIVDEILSDEDRRREYMMLGFRTRSGVGEQEFLERFKMDVAGAFGEELKREMDAGLVEYIDGIYRLTEKGFDLANQVFMDYV